jgi:hypothetical protein
MRNKRLINLRYSIGNMRLMILNLKSYDCTASPPQSQGVSCWLPIKQDIAVDDYQLISNIVFEEILAISIACIHRKKG